MAGFTVTAVRVISRIGFMAGRRRPSLRGVVKTILHKSNTLGIKLSLGVSGVYHPPPSPLDASESLLTLTSTAEPCLEWSGEVGAE